MSYATVNDILAELPQITDTVSNRAVLQNKLDAATAVIDAKLGFSFGDDAVGTQIVYGDDTVYLYPPTFVTGSVTGVTTITGIDVPDYVVKDGMLIVVDADGVIPDRGILDAYGIGGLRWQLGVPYTVAATFGYASVPADIKEACLQIAVRLWRAKDAGYSDVVGVEGSGAVGYNGALSNFTKMVLDKYRETRSLGVY